MMGMLFKLKIQKLSAYRGHKVFVEELAQIFLSQDGELSVGFLKDCGKEHSQVVGGSWEVNFLQFMKEIFP